MTEHEAQKDQKTYNSGYSPVVTHLTTNPPVHCLSTAERTGSSIFSVLWSYVEDMVHNTYHIDAVLFSLLIIHVFTRTSRFPSNHPNFCMGAKNKSRRRSRTYSGYSPVVTHLAGDVGVNKVSIPLSELLIMFICCRRMCSKHHVCVTRRCKGREDIPLVRTTFQSCKIVSLHSRFQSSLPRRSS
jgi:hypothetical protein